MAFTTTFTTSVRRGATTLTDTRTFTTSGVIEVSDVIADATTDGLLAISIDVSEVECVGITADQNLTIKTNSATAPQETLTVTANQMLFERTGDTALFSGDVTAMYVTNASGTDANLSIVVALDSTP